MRGRVKDPGKGKLKEIKATLPDADLAEALVELERRRCEIREGRTRGSAEATSFGDYSVSLLERKIRKGEIKSIKTREKWGYILRLHLIPVFGDLQMDQIRRLDVLEWVDGMAGMISNGTCKPNTANDRLSTLRVIINTYVYEMELDRNPIAGVRDFDTDGHDTYTEEDPNSLTPAELPSFLTTMRALYPQHFGIVALGFGTGLRPSSMRPLRRRGRASDVLWAEGTLLVRRSHTRRQTVMETTKTGRHQRLMLPAELMDILRWHVEQLPSNPMRDSDLLFPSIVGGLRTSAGLDKPFAKVCETLKLNKKITPRAMRRTFQDLARAANVKDIVTRAISGHLTEGMQRHYSTVDADEIRDGISKVVSLAGVREAMDQSVVLTGTGGVHDR